jgi:hypothetical protein
VTVYLSCNYMGAGQGFFRGRNLQPGL